MDYQSDKTDFRILDGLQKDGHLTNKELAQEIHLSPTPTFERVKRLEKEGYIRRYAAVLDAEKLDCGFTAFCNLKMKQHSYQNATLYWQGTEYPRASQEKVTTRL